MPLEFPSLPTALATPWSAPPTIITATSDGLATLSPSPPFNLIFAFTGNGVHPLPVPGTTDTLPFNWIIEWDRFVDKGSSVPDHFARKIDTRLAPPLKDMVNQGNQKEDEEIKKILKRMARRNLLRGYLFSIPTGQSVAEAMDVALSARTSCARATASN